MPTLEEIRERARQAKAQARQDRAEELVTWAHEQGGDDPPPTTGSRKRVASSRPSSTELLLARLIVAIEGLEERLNDPH